MENNRYLLRIADFKKMVRYIIGYVAINMCVFVTLVFMLEGGVLDKRVFPLEVVLVIFFVIFTAGFIWMQTKNAVIEEVIANSQSVYVDRYGNLLFSEVIACQVFKKKRGENLILTMRDGRKISFGPANFRKEEDKQIYRAFKTFIAGKVPQKSI